MEFTEEFYKAHENRIPERSQGMAKQLQQHDWKRIIEEFSQQESPPSIRELGAQEYIAKDFQDHQKDDNRDSLTALGADMNPGILDRKDTETEAEGRRGRRGGARTRDRPSAAVCSHPRDHGGLPALPAAPAGRPDRRPGPGRELAAAQGPGKSRLLGGLMEEGVQEALSVAVSEFSNDAYQSRATRVARARKQVVSGTSYFLDVELGRTARTKSQGSLDSCPFHGQPHLKRRKAVPIPG
ncbi:unnamed protein product [Rangifer tarandus platyrhynchus]|uniref:Cystatin domain-containing protein n=1 Tax=Rangifer tarandus platyrhynchus TaxID=3082113 RepID=A0ABN8YKT8_RANTA|nr:unnamed protein product [Rangifer tarandus platyrhynchus]